MITSTHEQARRFYVDSGMELGFSGFRDALLTEPSPQSQEVGLENRTHGLLLLVDSSGSVDQFSWAREGVLAEAGWCRHSVEAVRGFH